MQSKKGFNLTELIVVVVVIAILAALALPNFGAFKEKSLDKEAKASLALIQAAEKIYKMETNDYFPNDGSSESDIDTINTYLKLSLPTSNANWSYSVNANGGTGGYTTATHAGRTWSLPFSSDTYNCSPASACN